MQLMAALEARSYIPTREDLDGLSGGTGCPTGTTRFSCIQKYFYEGPGEVNPAILTILMK